MEYRAKLREEAIAIAFSFGGFLSSFVVRQRRWFSSSDTVYRSSIASFVVVPFLRRSSRRKCSLNL